MAALDSGRPQGNRTRLQDHKTGATAHTDRAQTRSSGSLYLRSIARIACPRSAFMTMKDVHAAQQEKQACRKEATNNQYKPRVGRFVVGG
jgi:hypothetical protein